MENKINKFENNNIYEEKPIQLLEFQGSSFKINNEALEFIRSIEEEIIVVSTVGKSRTGKSFLLNLLLDNVGKTGVNVYYNTLV